MSDVQNPREASRSDDPDREARIRADERATVADELHTLDDDDRRVREERMERDRLTHEELTARDDRDDRIVLERDEQIEVVRKRAFSVGQLLTMAAGGLLIALGVVALTRTGIDTPLDEPVEAVLGYNHTPLLGILEIGAGALLVLFSLRPGGRWFVAVVGLALILGGLLIFGEVGWTVDELGAERGYAWIPIAAGAVALLAALLTPRRYQRMTGVPTGA